MKLLSILLTTLLISDAYAQEFKTSLSEKRNAISVLGIMSTFKTDEGALEGNGIGIDFSHAFTRKTNLDFSISTALSQGKGVSSSFTGLSGYYYYNFFADCCDKAKTYSISGVPIVSEQTSDPYLLQVGVGINQFFLNGSKGVYSSSGLGVGANFLFRVWSYRVKLTARFSQMTSNETEVTGTFLGAGLIFPL